MAVDPEWRRLAYVKSDSAWRRQYRLLQSWYREHRLGLGAGTAFGRRLGNWLPEDAGNANFLSEEVAAYVNERLEDVRREGGTIHEDRRRRNMLSSMPLCFNLFGFLRRHPAPAARALRKTIGLDVESIERIEVEWAPPSALLGDKTAFDALIEFRTAGGGRGFVGIETKYTEAFGSQKLDVGKYRRVADELGVLRASPPVAPKRLTRQHWRNLLLAAAHARDGDYEVAASVIASCSVDKGAQRAVGELEQHAAFSVIHLPFESFIENLAESPELEDWARSFAERYLDLMPVSEKSHMPDLGVSS